MRNDVISTTETAPAATGATARGARLYRPLTDIVEAEDGITMMVEMPGVAADGVDIAVERRVLTIRGRAQRTNPENFRLVYAEYGEGDYERSFTLTDDFDPSRIEARMRNGLLTLKLPRAEAAQPKKIAVHAG